VKEQTERVMRAATALQVAALEWDDDNSPTQAEARQALIGMMNAMNELNLAEAQMRRLTERRRHGKA
jgi:hypothetical protein